MQDPDPTGEETEVSKRDGLDLPRSTQLPRGKPSQMLPGISAGHHVRGTGKHSLSLLWPGPAGGNLSTVNTQEGEWPTESNCLGSALALAFPLTLPKGIKE